MTFHYRDPDGDELTVAAGTRKDGTPVVYLHAEKPVHVTVDRLEELVAGLRDTARQAAAGPNPQHLGGRANAEDCPACWGTNPPYPFLCPGGAS